MFVHGEPKITNPPHVILRVFNIQLAYFTLIMQRSFSNYVDTTRWVGGTGNDNSMQIFPYNSKRIPSQIAIGGRWSIMGQT